ncbi:MAG: type III pantothenate kinase [Bdellovibrionales bacterium]|nr:type III pantothenate kinase [Bdellovibrionales bacterium]
MILALDVGNSQIFGGLFDGDKMIISFRKTSKSGSSSDEVGIFLRTVIRENGAQPEQIKDIAICTVVPDVLYSLKGACKKYFNINPFVLQAGVKTGLKIKYRNPIEVGADRIANAIACSNLFPNKNLVIVDLGTATTFCVVSKDKEYLGGSIILGLRISMESLESRTSKLPSVEIISMDEALGRSTIESIQSGLYFGHLGQMREIINHLKSECFEMDEVVVVGTGGFSHLFEKEKIFNHIIPDLVLKGLLMSLQINERNKSWN